ncbi:MAG: hypothetical protein DCC67_01465 [Planctomycetota bacterium]|nr:MAG: hypothetical protein DCC67_01465 [Planctomycetota bacterium]
MTTVPPTTITETGAERAEAAPTRWADAWQWLERRLVALTERANPILVKETRQALKSRQFLVTFIIVLIGCWVVSFVGVAVVGPQIYYAASGPGLLIFYYAILALPLALIVPYTAFRSLAAEQEEQTYDLLSITTLGSRQIVTGKLLSATVQMLVYLCAVSPCIAFTFLLRGVDALTTAMMLAMAVLGSLMLCMMALLIGAVARAKHTQIVTSVALVLGLFGAFVGAISLGTAILTGGSVVFREPEFWVIAFGLMMVYVTTFGLLRAAAAAQIAFVSENRSTPLRRWMMAQQACFAGWVGGVLYAFSVYESLGGGPLSDVIIAGGAMASFYWYAMGAMLTGEWPHLSRRVQRSLPQSTLARALLSLMNPGPGSGYLFAVANLTTLVLAGLAALWLLDAAAGTWTPIETAACFLVLAWSYVVGFLGFGRLLINLIRRWAYVPMAAAFLLHVILLLTAIGVPTVVQMMSREYRNAGYTLLQLTNPVWTLAELWDRGMAAVEGEILILATPALAVIALLLNMRSVSTELLHHRIPVPIRVAEDEAALHPAPEARPTSPWELDDDANGTV